MSKKLFLVAFAFLLSLLQLSSSAATMPKGVVHNPAIGSTFTVDSIVYKIVGDDKVEVNKYSGSDWRHDPLPSYMGEDSIEYHNKLVPRPHVAIPSTVVNEGVSYNVVNIGERAFAGFRPYFGVVSIPNTVTEIKKEAFHTGYQSIGAIVIPSSVTRIGADAFSGCVDLVRVYISDLESWMRIKFETAESNPMCHNAEVHPTMYPNYGGLFLVGNGTEIRNLEIPESVDSIGDYAFAGMSDIDTCKIGNNVKYIGKMAFFNLTADALIFGDSIKEIEDNAFLYALPKMVHANLEPWLRINFKGRCANPVSSYDGEGYRPYADKYGRYDPTPIAKLCFKDVLVQRLIIPKDIRKINSWAFWGNRNIKYLEADSVREIGEGAFSFCTSLWSVKLGDKLERIEDQAFNECNSLVIESENNNVRYVGYHAFYNCDNFPVAPIGDNIEFIGKGAFANCGKYMTATVGSKIKYIGSTAFGDAHGLNIKDFGAWLNADIENLYLDLCLKELYVDGNKMDGSTLVIPDGVPALKCNNMSVVRGFVTSITIPSDVTSIEGNYTLNLSGLKTITMLGTTPPSAFEDTFAKLMYKRVDLIVPEEAREAYLKAYPWYLFTKFSGVDGVERDGSAVSVNVSGCEITVNGTTPNSVVEAYSAGGQLVYKGTAGTFTVPGKGIYIVRVCGKAIKVAV